MKKFIVALAVICILSLGCVCAFAANINEQWVTGCVVDTDAGTVTFTYNAPAGSVWTEMLITTETLTPSATDDQFWDFYNKGVLARNENVTVVDGRVVGKTGVTADSNFDFVENTTYTVVLFSCDGSNWNYSSVPYTFVYAVPPTADLSVIAYAAAAVTGCGALVVMKKKK